MHTALTIAGSDSGGGAGIQADLKTFAAHGVYGTSAITAITAQNTLGVLAWRPVPPELVTAQIDAVLSDIGAHAVKIGMLGSVEVARAVARTLDGLRLPNLVLDPVMVAKGGARLIDEDAVAVLIQELLPLADVVTPNIPEAEVLAGCRIHSVDGMRQAAQAILARGPRAVLVKGGHADGPLVVDVGCTASGFFELSGPRIDTRATHGTGCTLSSAIAANLANGLPAEEAMAQARRYLEGALRSAPRIGAGHGPVNHLWRLQDTSG